MPNTYSLEAGRSLKRENARTKNNTLRHERASERKVPKKMFDEKEPYFEPLWGKVL